MLFQHTIHHPHYSLVTGHILARALGAAQDNRRTKFLRYSKYGLGPLQVINIESVLLHTCRLLPPAASPWQKLP